MWLQALEELGLDWSMKHLPFLNRPLKNTVSRILLHCTASDKTQSREPMSEILVIIAVFLSSLEFPNASAEVAYSSHRPLEDSRTHQNTNKRLE